jgi:hypothetical protein
MSTVLISKEGVYKVYIVPLLNPANDGYLYRVVQTGKTFSSESRAIRNGRYYLKRQRQKAKDAHIVFTKVKRKRTKHKRRRTKWNQGNLN